MASFAGKIGFKISPQLQCRVYSIPWAIWKNQVTCLKSRHHSSSAPVRYIPKTSSKVKLSETSPQVKNLEKNNYFNRADARESEISGEESDRGKFSQREVSQIQNEMQNDLLFGDVGQGELLSNILQYYNICNSSHDFRDSYAFGSRNAWQPCLPN